MLIVGPFGFVGQRVRIGGRRSRRADGRPTPDERGGPGVGNGRREGSAWVAPLGFGVTAQLDVGRRSVVRQRSGRGLPEGPPAAAVAIADAPDRSAVGMGERWARVSG